MRRRSRIRGRRDRIGGVRARSASESGGFPGCLASHGFSKTLVGLSGLVEPLQEFLIRFGADHRERAIQQGFFSRAACRFQDEVRASLARGLRGTIDRIALGRWDPQMQRLPGILGEAVVVVVVMASVPFCWTAFTLSRRNDKVITIRVSCAPMPTTATASATARPAPAPRSRAAPPRRRWPRSRPGPRTGAWRPSSTWSACATSRSAGRRPSPRRP